jgi:hypothetical protein
MRREKHLESTRYEDGRRGASRRAGLAMALLVLLGAPPAGRAEETDRAPNPEAPALEPTAVTRSSWGKRLFFYAPNRVMDLLDIFRLRFRLGPGLAVQFRMTDYGAFYVGKYDSVYVGLPGPRAPHRFRSPMGMESLHGIVLAGVDATDDTRHGPEYGAAETDVGVQFLLVGAEAGFDAIELVDFLGGLLFFDPRNDDYPRAARVLPETTSGISLGAGTGVFQVEPKPDTFDSTGARLDYLHLNVQRRISEPLRATDAHFAVDPDAPIVPPQTQFRLGLYTSFEQGEGFDFQFSPDVQIDVELPNLEQKLRVFVESARDNALPQSEITEQEDKGINVGARKFYERLNLSFDAGVRAKWPPLAFTRVSWKRTWDLGRVDISSELRAFYQTDTGVGALASLFGNCWLGDSNTGILLQDVSAKWTDDKDTFEWATSLSAGRVVTLLDETQRGHHIRWADTARAQGLKYAVFGSYGNVDKHRLGFGFRGPLYKKWIYWELDPALQWDREEDYDTAYVFQVGIDMLFWGQAYE